MEHFLGQADAKSGGPTFPTEFRENGQDGLLARAARCRVVGVSVHSRLRSRGLADAGGDTAEHRCGAFEQELGVADRDRLAANDGDAGSLDGGSRPSHCVEP